MWGIEGGRRYACCNARGWREWGIGAGRFQVVERVGV